MRPPARLIVLVATMLGACNASETNGKEDPIDSGSPVVDDSRDTDTDSDTEEVDADGDGYSDEVDCDFSPCVTTEGPDKYNECRFPFEYAGRTFSSCTRMDSVTGEPWCPTDLDVGRRYKNFKWTGTCGPGCTVTATAVTV